jgi:hypothetical protein
MNTIFHSQTPNKSGLLINDRVKLILFILIFYLFLNLLHIGCPIKFMTGISCPGCGMTRAVRSALLFDFKDAFYYHPLFLLSPVMVFLFLFETYINPKLNKITWSVIIVLFSVTYIIRLLILKNEVVEIDIASGVVLELLHNIFVGGNK